MARKIRFPLKMQNGADVRTIEELRENFDLESVLGYYANGKLATWLSDRYYDAEAEKIKSIDHNSKDLNKQICEIIGVECVEESTETDLEAIKLRNERIATLRQITDDEEIIKNVDSVAFDQDELFDLLDDNTEVIYLFGEKFSVPLGKGNVKYVGVNNPLVLLGTENFKSYEDNNILFKNVRFEDKINLLLKKDEPTKPEYDKKQIEEWLLNDVTEIGYINVVELMYTIFKGKVYFLKYTGDDKYVSLYSADFDGKNQKPVECPEPVKIYNSFDFSESRANKQKIIDEYKNCFGHTNDYLYYFQPYLRSLLFDFDNDTIIKKREFVSPIKILRKLDNKLICEFDYEGSYENYLENYLKSEIITYDFDKAGDELFLHPTEILIAKGAKNSFIYHEEKIYYIMLTCNYTDGCVDINKLKNDYWDKIIHTCWRNNNYEANIGSSYHKKCDYEKYFNDYFIRQESNFIKDIAIWLCYYDFTNSTNKKALLVDNFYLWASGSGGISNVKYENGCYCFYYGNKGEALIRSGENGIENYYTSFGKDYQVEI